MTTTPRKTHLLRPLPARGLLILVLNLGTVLSLWSAEYRIHGVTDKATAVYKPGETMTFTLRVFDKDAPVEDVILRWTRMGDDGKTEKGEGKVGAKGLQVKTSLAKPGFVRLRAFAFKDGKPLTGHIGGKSRMGKVFFEGGACVQPEKLQPVPEPKDFDTFWDGMKATLAKVPMKAERVHVKNVNPGRDTYAVTLACAGPKPVTGYLCIPTGAKKASLPARITFQGYGVYEQGPPKWTSSKEIVLGINAHGMKIPAGKEYVAKLKEKLKKYGFNKKKNESPETTYFFGMALRVLRALEYVKSLPEWNGKVLEATGGSQGGLQALWAAGLDPAVTSTRARYPWCCDLGGYTQGRIRGWRPDYTPALLYYDPVYHARRAKGKIHLISGLGDYVSPPSSIWILYNQIPHKDKSMEVRQGCTHSFLMKNHATSMLTPAGARVTVSK